MSSIFFVSVGVCSFVSVLHLISVFVAVLLHGEELYRQEKKMVQNEWVRWSVKNTTE